MDSDLKSMDSKMAECMQAERDVKRLHVADAFYQILRNFNASQLQELADLRRVSTELAYNGTDLELAGALANSRNAVLKVVKEMNVIDMYDNYNKYVK